jgi:hypothetical protein
MKKAALLLALLLSSGLYQQSASAQIFKKLISAAKGSTTGTPSELEIGSALKQALEKAATSYRPLMGFLVTPPLKSFSRPRHKRPRKPSAH